MDSYDNVIPSEEGSLRAFIVFNGDSRLMVLKKEGMGRPKTITIPEGEMGDWYYMWAELEGFLHPHQQAKAVLSYAEVVKSCKLPKGRFSLGEDGDGVFSGLRVVKEDNRRRVAFLARCLVAEPNSNAVWNHLAELAQELQVVGRSIPERGWWWLDSKMVLIDCGSIKKKEEVLKEWRRKEWTKECPLQSWHPLLTHCPSKDGAERRGHYWLSISGIPAHLWDGGIFAMIVEPFGIIVLTDRGGESETDLSCLRLLVNCKVEEVPRRYVLKWKAFCFEVRIDVEWRNRVWLEEELATARDTVGSTHRSHGARDTDRNVHRSQVTPTQFSRLSTHPQTAA